MPIDELYRRLGSHPEHVSLISNLMSIKITIESVYFIYI